MDKTGVIIVNGFAVLWLAFAKLNGAPMPWIILPLAACLSGLLVWVCVKQTPAKSLVSVGEGKRISRIFMWSSIAEGVGIFFVINILANVGMADRYMAGIALVVGLHFVPIAIGVPIRLALALAIAMLVLSVVGFLIPSPEYASLVVGCGGAATLWIGAIASVVRMAPRNTAH